MLVSPETPTSSQANSREPAGGLSRAPGEVEGGTYDFLIIGAGVVGCSIARELAKFKGNCLVVEKGDDVASGISKANSGVLHAGFYVPPNTLKAKLNVQGHAQFKRLSEELGFEVRAVEKLVIGMNEEEQKHLQELYETGQKNGVPGLRLIGRKEIADLEPNVNGEFALHSPLSAIIEPYQFTIALAENASRNGVQFVFDSAVVGIDRPDKRFRVRTSAGSTFFARWVVNSAGVHSDDVSRLVADTPHTVYPVRGEYYITEKVAGLFQRMIYPVPPAHGSGLGVHFTPTIENNVLIGPSAQYIDDKEDTSNTAATMRTLKAEIHKYIPKLANVDLIRNFSGIRPKLVSRTGGPRFADFVIEENPAVDHFIDLIGIESPGLTAAPAIARMVVEIIGGREDLTEDSDFCPHRESPKRFALMSPEDQARAIAENEEHGVVVCRCETVTQAEVIRAIENPLGVRSLDAVKRRCRSMMGRCQGGFCEPRIAELLIDRYGMKPTDIRRNVPGSYVFTGLVKD